MRQRRMSAADQPASPLSHRLPHALIAKPPRRMIGSMDPGTMWGMMWGASGMMGLGFIFWVLVIVAVGVLVWWLIGQPRAPRRDSALDILRERYARGEIDRNEFEARRRDLTG